MCLPSNRPHSAVRRPTLSDRGHELFWPCCYGQYTSCLVPAGLRPVITDADQEQVWVQVVPGKSEQLGLLQAWAQ